MRTIESSVTPVPLRPARQTGSHGRWNPVNGKFVCATHRGEPLAFRCLNFTGWTRFELRSKLSECNRSAFRRRINTLIRPHAEQPGCDEELQCRGAPIFRLQTSQPALRQLER